MWRVGGAWSLLVSVLLYSHLRRGKASPPKQNGKEAVDVQGPQATEKEKELAFIHSTSATAMTGATGATGAMGSSEVCCKAMTVQCFACTAGVSVEKFCDLNKDHWVCEPSIVCPTDNRICSGEISAEDIPTECELPICDAGVLDRALSPTGSAADEPCETIAVVNPFENDGETKVVCASSKLGQLQPVLSQLMDHMEAKADKLEALLGDMHTTTSPPRLQLSKKFDGALEKAVASDEVRLLASLSEDPLRSNVDPALTPIVTDATDAQNV